MIDVTEVRALVTIANVVVIDFRPATHYHVRNKFLVDDPLFINPVGSTRSGPSFD